MYFFALKVSIDRIKELNLLRQEIANILLRPYLLKTRFFGVRNSIVFAENVPLFFNSIIFA